MAPDILAEGLYAVAAWLNLKLNPAKMRVLYLDRGVIVLGIQLPTLDKVLLTPAPAAKSWGVILDASLFTAVERSTFFHL